MAVDVGVVRVDVAGARRRADAALLELDQLARRGHRAKLGPIRSHLVEIIASLDNANRNLKG